MTLFPIRLLNSLHPVAAADYFLSNPFLAWFALNIIGIIPIERKNFSREQNPLNSCSEYLKKDNILIFYPEGSRGEPESLSNFKSGIAHLAKHHPSIPIYPIFLHGLGKALPKGTVVIVPFFCDVFLGEPILWTGDKKSFMDLLNERIQDLASEENLPAWE